MLNECFIVGGGPSLLGFDFSLLSGKDVIVVNKAVEDYPQANYFITVDYTFLRKIQPDLLKTVSASKAFIACLHLPYMVERDGRIIDTRYNLIYDLSDFDVVIKSRRADGFGFKFSDFRNGYNSGYCALQLALILGYKRIYLLGFDLIVQYGQPRSFTHYHNGYGQNIKKFEKKLDLYYTCFLEGLTQLKDTGIEVISCSLISRLNDIIPFEEVFKS